MALLQGDATVGKKGTGMDHIKVVPGEVYGDCSEII